MIRKTLSLIACFLLASILHAENAKTIFNEANQLFSKANQAALTDPTKAQNLYEKATLKYRYLIEEEKINSAGLHINLANSYFQTGENGLAVLHYQRALALDPINSEASHNLNYLRSLVIDELPETRIQQLKKAVTFWHRWPFSIRLALLATANLVFWAAATRLFFKKSNTTYFLLWSGATISIIFGFSILASYQRWDNFTDGVIVEDEVIARQGDGIIYANAFNSPLHAGTEFQLLETRGDWNHVRLLNQETCWLSRDSLELIEK